MRHTASILIALLAAGGSSAAAQPANPDQPRSGPRFRDTSAKPTSARATPVHPAPTRPGPQAGNPANANRAVFVPILANTQDTSAVSASYLGEPIDLRQPLQFDRVFALRSSAPSDMRGGTLLNFGGANIATSGSQLDTQGANWFARVDGAIIALFPRSTYSQTSDGTVVDIPAGTIFAIGHPPAAMFGLDESTPKRAPQAPDVVDSSRPTAPPANSSAARTLPAMLVPADPAAASATANDQTEQTTAAHAPGPSGSPSIFSDEAYRARRVRGLLFKALPVRPGSTTRTTSAGTK